jgi:ribosomal protein S18 acetylase RimI-like enzyme
MNPAASSSSPEPRIEIQPYCHADETAVIALWEECGLIRPWNDPRKDIARKLRVNPEWFAVAKSEGRLVGTVMAGYEGHRGWINYLAVAPGRQRTGIGRFLMIEAERWLRDAGCPKISLQVRGGNKSAMAFYKRLGFSVDEVVSLGKRLEVDGPTPSEAR